MEYCWTIFFIVISWISDSITRIHFIDFIYAYISVLFTTVCFPIYNLLIRLTQLHHLQIYFKLKTMFSSFPKDLILLGCPPKTYFSPQNYCFWIHRAAAVVHQPLEGHTAINYTEKMFCWPRHTYTQFEIILSLIIWHLAKTRGKFSCNLFTPGTYPVFPKIQITRVLFWKTIIILQHFLNRILSNRHHENVNRFA